MFFFFVLVVFVERVLLLSSFVRDYNKNPYKDPYQPKNISWKC